MELEFHLNIVMELEFLENIQVELEFHNFFFSNNGHFAKKFVRKEWNPNLATKKDLKQYYLYNNFVRYDQCVLELSVFGKNSII